MSLVEKGIEYLNLKIASNIHHKIWSILYLALTYPITKMENCMFGNHFKAQFNKITRKQWKQLLISFNL